MWAVRSHDAVERMRKHTLVGFLIAATAALAAPAAAQRSVFGNWRVTGSKCPSSCAIGSAEASSWRGRVASYGDTLARFVVKDARHLLMVWENVFFELTRM